MKPTMSKSLPAYIDELRSIKKRLEEITHGKQINPKIADDFIQIGQFKVKFFLEKLFANEFGVLVDENNYSEFILYSYKSYHGDIPAQVFNEKQVYRRRFNLLQKGRRWKDSGKLFYDFLDRINERFNDTPVNLFGELCSQLKIQHLIVKTSKKPPLSAGEPIITLPDLDLLKQIKVSGVSIASQFDTYIQNIKGGRLKSQNISRLRRVENDLNSLDVKTLIDNAAGNKNIKPFVNQVKSFFKLKDGDDVTVQRVVKSFFTYQFNDLPYDLHLFFPKNGNFNSTLMIALPPETILEDYKKEFFIQLVNELTFLDDYEEKIVNATRENNDSYIIWKKIYEREYDRFYTFMKSVENLCFSICKQNNISFSHLSGRIKTFDGFYNKIFTRANEEIEGIRQDKDISYAEAIKEPHMHYNRIFNVIRDLAGIRVVLLFEEDINKIVSIFESLESPTEDLIVKEPRFYEKSIEDEDINIPQLDKTAYGYRSVHITVLPGKDRLKLVEYNNLADIHCEIQFRSILAHAWADVNHDLDYKHREIISEITPQRQIVLREKFNKLAEELLKSDKYLNEIRESDSEEGN